MRMEEKKENCDWIHDSPKARQKLVHYECKAGLPILSGR